MVTLGTTRFLLDAVGRHLRDHQDRMPREIRLNHAVRADWLASMDYHERLCFVHLPNGDELWREIKITTTYKPGAYLVTCDNVIEPI